MHIVMHTLKAVGIHLEGLTLSSSSRYIAWKGARKEIGEKVQIRLIEAHNLLLILAVNRFVTMIAKFLIK